MAILNQKRILNLIPKTSAPVTIHVSQGDVGTEIEFTLVKGDELFVNTGSLSASVHGVREDGANFGVFTCTLSGSSVKFPLHAEMTAVKGSAIAEIVLVDSQGNKVGSSNFGIMVEESVFPLGVTYDNDVSVYESILAYAQTIPVQVQGEIDREANARISADSNLQSQIDQIIAPSGEAPSAAEVQNARIDADGVTYDTLGKAIRTQYNELSKDINEINNNKNYTVVPNVSDSYYINSNDGSYNHIGGGSIYWATEDYIRIPKEFGYDHVILDTAFTSGVAGIAFYDANYEYISGSQAAYVAIPSNAIFLRYTTNDLNYDIRKIVFIKENEPRFNFVDTYEGLKNVHDKYVEIEPSLTTGYIDISDGRISGRNNPKYALTDFIEIPTLTTKIIHNFRQDSYGLVGFVFFNDCKNYISGISTENDIVNIPSNARYIIATDYNVNETHYNRFLHFVTDGLMNVVTRTVTMEKGYVDYTNGNYSGLATYSHSPEIEIEDGAQFIITDDCVFNRSGIGGYAFYASDHSYISGGQQNTMPVPSGAKYFRFCTYETLENAPTKNYSFARGRLKKIIAFSGDSITYGYDDNNSGKQLPLPWPEYVQRKLDVLVGNYGVSSASLMPQSTPFSVYTSYTDFAQEFDIIGFMIGINDCFRGYDFGTINDDTTDTYLGCLNLLLQGAISRWAPSNNKHVFIMTYPHNDQPENQRQDVVIGDLTGWAAWNEGIRQVAAKYSVPVCDVYNELGITPQLDTAGVYWDLRGGGAYHSAHLTQVGANVFGEFISNWLKKQFGATLS